MSTAELTRVRASWDAWTSYLVLVCLTGAACTMLYASTLLTLARFDHLPPPPFINSLCADAKLEFLRQHPPQDPTDLVVGSSVAWRNVSSQRVVDRYPEARPFNGGMCGLQIDQTRFMTDFLIELYPSVRTVLLLVDAQDLRSCPDKSRVLFDKGAVRSYLTARSTIPFYFHYFDVVSLIRNARDIKAKRQNLIPLDPLVLTPYGDGPLDADSRGLTYGGATASRSCLAVLQDLARDVTAGGRRMIVTISPLHPQWREKFDRDGDLARNVEAALRSVATPNLTFWDGSRSSVLEPDQFVDAVHLRWPSVPRFTDALIDATGFGAPVHRG